MSIKFFDYLFSEPILLSNWSPPYKAGVYVILKHDSTCRPKPYTSLYFGISSNMSERGFGGHHARNCWIRNAGSADKLYIATGLMPNSTATQRQAAETTLIAAYLPPCNQ